MSRHHSNWGTIHPVETSCLTVVQIHRSTIQMHYIYIYAYIYIYMYMYVYIYYNIIIMYNHIAANVLPEGSKLRVLRSSARYHQKSQSRKMRFPETQWSGGHFTHKGSSPQGFWWIPGQFWPRARSTGALRCCRHGWPDLVRWPCGVALQRCCEAMAPSKRPFDPRLWSQATGLNWAQTWYKSWRCENAIENRIQCLVGGLEHDWIMTFHILGISSSQLTNSYFSEG